MKYIWPKNLKRTRQRESILAILENAEKPLSASDICSKMEEGGGTAWMSTIYRVLELFEKNDMVIRINVMNNEMAVYELNRYQHKHYAVCLSCHKIIAMNNCPMDNFVPSLEDDEFRVVGHNLEILGYCKDCKEHAKCKPEKH